MRALIAVPLLAALLAGVPAAADPPRTESAYYAARVAPIPRDQIPTLLCSGSLPARPAGACFSILPSETSVAIDVQDYTSEIAEGNYYFYDTSLVRVPATGFRMCGPSVTVPIPAGAAYVVVIPAAHAYPLDFDTCRHHPISDRHGILGTIVATFLS